MENKNGVFITSQEELTEDVYNALIYRPKSRRIREEVLKELGK